ncbi:MAG: hypothetical protein KY475_12715 [Planctomycetes bacterium]|nr:hypothetical protein [Planctomycetota bacterium]
MNIIEQDLADFQQFVAGRIQSDREESSLEDYVCLWRAQQERAGAIAAIQEGLDDLAAGRVRSADDVLAELRQPLN